MRFSVNGKTGLSANKNIETNPMAVHIVLPAGFCNHAAAPMLLLLLANLICSTKPGKMR